MVSVERLRCVVAHLSLPTCDEKTIAHLLALVLPASFYYILFLVLSPEVKIQFG